MYSCKMFFILNLIHKISIIKSDKIALFWFGGRGMRRVVFCAVFMFLYVPHIVCGGVASSEYVGALVNSLKTTAVTAESTDEQIPTARAVYQVNATVTNSINQHTTNKNNPHVVTAGQIGLGNVKNLDQTNANNLSSGTVGYARLPVGTIANTIAAGNDVRFNAVMTSQPEGTPPTNMVWIWFEK